MRTEQKQVSHTFSTSCAKQRCVLSRTRQAIRNISRSPVSQPSASWHRSSLSVTFHRLALAASSPHSHSLGPGHCELALSSSHATIQRRLSMCARQRGGTTTRYSRLVALLSSRTGTMTQPARCAIHPADTDLCTTCAKVSEDTRHHVDNDYPGNFLRASSR